MTVRAGRSKARGASVAAAINVSAAVAARAPGSIWNRAVAKPAAASATIGSKSASDGAESAPERRAERYPTGTGAVIGARWSLRATRATR